MGQCWSPLLFLISLRKWSNAPSSFSRISNCKIFTGVLLPRKLFFLIFVHPYRLVCPQAWTHLREARKNQIKCTLEAYLDSRCTHLFGSYIPHGGEFTFVDTLAYKGDLIYKKNVQGVIGLPWRLSWNLEHVRSSKSRIRHRGNNIFIESEQCSCTSFASLLTCGLSCRLSSCWRRMVLLALRRKWTCCKRWTFDVFSLIFLFFFPSLTPFTWEMQSL